MSPSDSAVDPAVPQNDKRFIVLGAVLGVVAVVMVGTIIYCTLRMKRRGPANEKAVEGALHGTGIDDGHPASRITPFGSPGGETPQFRHTPGSGMRIAIRRPDGAWQFSDPRAPFTPSGTSDIDSPWSSTASFASSFRTKKKEQESKRTAFEREYDLESNPDILPPPAYPHESGGYIDHTGH